MQVVQTGEWPVASPVSCIGEWPVASPGRECERPSRKVIAGSGRAVTQNRKYRNIFGAVPDLEGRHYREFFYPAFVFAGRHYRGLSRAVHQRSIEAR
eukprot:10476240-Karenia_brevis.AAC.1